MTLIDLANPTRFLSFTARMMPWLVAATSASGCRHTSVPSAARLITPQTNIDSHAFGT